MNQMFVQAEPAVQIGSRQIPYKHVVAVAFVLGFFMDVLDTTIVNVALPTLKDDFGADINTIEWVVTGYLLSLALWIPCSGWLGDRFGTKRIFVFALTVFTLASTLCGLAWNTCATTSSRPPAGSTSRASCCRGLGWRPCCSVWLKVRSGGGRRPWFSCSWSVPW